MRANAIIATVLITICVHQAQSHYGSGYGNGNGYANGNEPDRERISIDRVDNKEGRTNDNYGSGGYGGGYDNIARVRRFVDAGRNSDSTAERERITVDRVDNEKGNGNQASRYGSVGSGVPYSRAKRNVYGSLSTNPDGTTNPEHEKITIDRVDNDGNNGNGARYGNSRVGRSVYGSGERRTPNDEERERITVDRVNNDDGNGYNTHRYGASDYGSYPRAKRNAYGSLSANSDRATNPEHEKVTIDRVDKDGSNTYGGGRGGYGYGNNYNDGNYPRARRHVHSSSAENGGDRERIVVDEKENADGTRDYRTHHYNTNTNGGYSS